ncbi:hypothetical protein C8J57DRAFT_1332014, partial [Mycena rebaudengoi]
MHTNAFRDLRRSLQTIGGHVDQGYERYAFQDSGMTSDIRLRVVEVLEFDNVTPIFLVLCRHTLRRGPLAPWADAVVLTTLKE